MAISQTEESQLRQLYDVMYKAMIAKDIPVLDSLLSDNSVLIHMTGMRQPKREYLKAIANGTLNYYSCENSEIEVKENGDSARMTGKSKVYAAVFGGGRHTWSLRLDIDWRKIDGHWKITEMSAGTY